MHFDTPALVFIGTALAIGGACLSYLKTRFRTTDHHLMIFAVVAAIGYLAPMHIHRAAQLERERMKQAWSGNARAFAHELERSSTPLGSVDTASLQRTVARVSERLSIPSADLQQATLMTRNPLGRAFRRVPVSLSVNFTDTSVGQDCDAKVDQAFTDQEVWCEEMSPVRKTSAIQVLIPLRDQENAIEGVLGVRFSVDHWNRAQENAEWRVASEFMGLLSICLLMAGFLVNAGENRRKRELEKVVRSLKSEVETLDGMVNSVNGVIWERSSHDHAFTFVSQQADGCFGYPLDRWLSEESFLEDVIHEEDLARVKSSWEEALASGKDYRIEYRLRCADGTIAFVVENGHANKLPIHGSVFRGILVDITAQRQAEASIKDMNRMMLDASRQAGMAEIATGVLHNVGNVLNSLNVGAKLLHERLQRSRMDRLCQATALLKEHLPNNMDFFVQDKRGRALPGYLEDLANYLREEQLRLASSVGDMIDRIDHIRDVIMLQQSHSKVHTLWESVDLATVMEDALRLETSTHGSQPPVKVERQYADVPPVYIARGLLLQILVNLISNAHHAMEKVPQEERLLILRIGPTGADGVRMVVEDNGCGIPDRYLTKIFTQGFTTKRAGHGFGLHHASLLVDDLGGSLRAESEGEGKGARFTLDLPARKAPGTEKPDAAGAPLEPTRQEPHPITASAPETDDQRQAPNQGS